MSRDGFRADAMPQHARSVLTAMPARFAMRTIISPKVGQAPGLRGALSPAPECGDFASGARLTDCTVCGADALVRAGPPVRPSPCNPKPTRASAADPGVRPT